MNISDKLRAHAISELMDEISTGMTAEGHDLPEETIMVAAEKQLEDMIRESMAAMQKGQRPAVIKDAMMVQGISVTVAEALITALTN